MRASYYRIGEYRIGANGGPVAALEDDEGPYRLRRDRDAAWPPADRAYGGQAGLAWRRAAAWALVAARLFVPILLLLILLVARYLFSDACLPLPAASWTVRGMPVEFGTLAIGDLVLPASWFALHLTNRCYGPGYAFGQLLASLVLAGLVILVNPHDILGWAGHLPAITPRGALSFGPAFLLASFVAIVFFDGARGPRWWTAPLQGSFAAALVFCGVYYPAAFAGVNPDWPVLAAVHFTLFFAVSIALLAVYWILRPAMRPMPGMNGY